jgi:hypothetical protein
MNKEHQDLISANLYIEIVNGQANNHPILESNLLEAFPGIDLNNLPPNYAKFKRIYQEDCGLPEPTDYKKKIHRTKYVLNKDGYWKDHWEIINKEQHEIDLIEKTHKKQNLHFSNLNLKNLKRTANSIFHSLTDPDEIQVWKTYFEMMNKIKSHDPHDQLIPTFPVLNSNGKFVPNLDSSGNWILRLLHDPDTVNNDPLWDTRPKDGKKYYYHNWSESWIEYPEKPNDGKNYYFSPWHKNWIEESSANTLSITANTT